MWTDETWAKGSPLTYRWNRSRNEWQYQLPGRDDWRASARLRGTRYLEGRNEIEDSNHAGLNARHAIVLSVE